MLFEGHLRTIHKPDGLARGVLCVHTEVLDLNNKEIVMGQIRVREPFGGLDLRNFFRGFFDDEQMGLGQWMNEGSLAVDISEGKEGETIVRASLPGFKRDDVQVSVHNGVLDIKAESKEETETQGEKFFRKERRYGSVSRRIALPGNPSGEDVVAELKDGVLTVKVPGNTKSGPKKVEIR
jgi:HSP20 family protein